MTPRSRATVTRQIKELQTLSSPVSRHHAKGMNGLDCKSPEIALKRLFAPRYQPSAFVHHIERDMSRLCEQHLLNLLPPTEKKSASIQQERYTEGIISLLLDVVAEEPYVRFHVLILLH